VTGPKEEDCDALNYSNVQFFYFGRAGQPPDMVHSNAWTIEMKAICFKPRNCPPTHGFEIAFYI
jgi:hypothetical protein